MSSDVQDLNGRYQILSLLGEGGTGHVYLARHLVHRRLEAVKVLKPEVARSMSARFRREARAMNRLRHPNIVSVYDFGQLEDGNFFLAMEYADGENLADIVDCDKLPLARAVRLLIQMADAIDHAHCNEVIHRDLKPGNMIIERQATSGDVVRILDFGVAKILGSEGMDSALTGQMIMGTPAYMAPEQVRGVGDVPSIDIYALGCIAYQLLTGRPPFVGRNMQVLHSHVSERPSPLCEYTDEELPEELEDLVMRCLRKRPETRPHSGATVANILRGVLATLVKDRGATAADETLRGLGAIADPRGKRGADTVMTEVSPELAASASNSQRLRAWQSALRQLAETLVDGGCTDAGLMLAVASANRQTREVARVRTEIEELRREREALDSKMHDRLLSLRFSLGELNFARQQGRHSEAEAIAMGQVIGDIEGQLSKTEQMRSAKQAHLDQSAVRLASELSDQQDERDQAFRDLEGVIHDLLPGFAHNDEIRRLAANVDGLRPASEAVTTVMERAP
ncbi:MAG: serine/threonine protein kinase [Deltaproteobacteria bacterium]|nr:serine/threonine protein kinase [Deltaproteobacteria bacterium]